VLSGVRAACGSSNFGREWAAGAALSLDEAVTAALALLGA
jgi:hypothetical protein